MGLHDETMDRSQKAYERYEALYGDVSSKSHFVRQKIVKIAYTLDRWSSPGWKIARSNIGSMY